MARVAFVAYLAVAAVCAIITLAHPPWWGSSNGFNGGLYGALASIAAALPWSILLWLVAQLLYELRYLLGPDPTFGYRIAGMLFYGACWGFVILNLYILRRLATNRRMTER
jgi:hypothetical protein